MFISAGSCKRDFIDHGSNDTFLYNLILPVIYIYIQSEVRIVFLHMR